MAESTTAEGRTASPTGPGATGAAPASGLRAGVHITDAAVQYAKRRLEQRGTPGAAVRLGIRGGGCSGFQYVIEFSDDPPRSRDTVSEFEGVKFYVDKKSLIYLGGSTLDYVKSLMFQGFKFLNPQEATNCGCGHSFTVK
ncbi:MAG TPA: iron-sulfur cluster assembly accessory protein [Polyangiaceae bacterium]|nr:iron-sulfur cluster assembly accessory protein [Polyangiaceae bacterium]